MKDKDFDKIFAHKMGQLAGPTFQEESWSDLSSRLHAHQQRRRAAWIPLWFLIGLLAAGNVFWWNQWRTLVSNQVVPNVQSTFVQSTDTLVNQTIVYQRDTIYQYITRTRLAYPSKDAGLGLDTYDLSRQTTNTSSDDTRGTASDLTQLTSSDASTSKEEKVENAAQNVSETNLIRPTHTVGSADSMTNNTVAATVSTSNQDTVQTQVVQPSQVTRAPRLYIARPRLGMLVGWSDLQFAGKRGGTAPPLSFGIQGGIEIARNIQLEGNALYLRMGAKSDSINVLEGHANIPSPGSDYILRYWEVYNLKALVYSLSVRYDLPKWRALSPYIGIGGQASTLFSYDVEYEFRNTNDYLEINLPAFIGAKTHLQGLLMKVGAEGTIKPNWVVGAETFWLRGFAPNRHFLDRQWGIHLKLLHLF